MTDDFARGFRTRVTPLIGILSLLGWRVERRTFPDPAVCAVRWWRGAGFDTLIIKSADDVVARRDVVSPGDTMRQEWAEVGTVEKMFSEILNLPKLRPASEIRAVRRGP